MDAASAAILWTHNEREYGNNKHDKGIITFIIKNDSRCNNSGIKAHGEYKTTYRWRVHDLYNTKYTWRNWR